MPNTTSRTALHSFMYGGAAMLLVLDSLVLLKAVLTQNFIPLVPVVVSILTATGLLFIVYAENKARQQDARDHRRISRVAHQLESPLFALQADLQDLLKNSDALPSDSRLKLKHMETKTMVLLENVRDVFLLLQAQEKPVSQDVRAYNLCTLVEGVVESQRSVASARNVELIYSNHCQEASVKVDRRFFLIALTHLIENAIVYTTTPGWVNVAVIKGAQNIRIVIQDRGIGISRADSLLLLQPFARGTSAESYDADGIGVGLSLTCLLVSEWGGKLRWQTRGGSLGSEFEIVLPIAKERKKG